MLLYITHKIINIYTDWKYGTCQYFGKSKHFHVRFAIVLPFSMNLNEFGKISTKRWGRHAKRRHHATIGRGNIFRLRKDKDWSTVEFVETINLNDHFFA